MTAGSLAGKVVVVTAAAQGIGRASAEIFAREGAKVWATDLDIGSLADVDGLHVAKLNVCDSDAVVDFFSNIGPIDVLFNCAGFVANGTILDCTPADWSRSYDINVTAMYRTIRASLPGMIANGGGSIINMSSVASSIKGVPNRFVYGTTKAAVIGLTKAVAADYVTNGIRCNAICPGTIDTPSLRERLASTGDFDAAWQTFTSRQPMGRFGRPEEIAGLALYLATDASSFVTGQSYAIDGGWTI